MKSCLVSCSVLTLLFAYFPIDTDCQARVDVVFVVDSSGSVGSANFRNIITFMYRIIDRFNIGPDSTLVGLVRYSTRARVRIRLGSYTVKSSLLGVIRGLNPETNGRTNTPMAIRLATRQLTGRRARADAKKIMIVITDGMSNEGGLIAPPASMAKDAGIEVFVFGVGRGVDEAELRVIASEPPATHLFRPDNFTDTELNQFIPSLVSRKCVGESSSMHSSYCNHHNYTFCILMYSAASCTERVDLIFVLDSSAAATSMEFMAMTDFVAMAVTRFNISANHTQVGVVRYGAIANVAIPIGSQQSVTSLMTAVKNLDNSTSGVPNIANAISVGAAHFPRVQASDPDVKRVMVVFASQVAGTTNIGPIATAARQAANANIELFAIGTAESSVLNAIASDPDSTHVFQSNASQLNTMELSTFINDFATRACASECVMTVHVSI